MKTLSSNETKIKTPSSCETKRKASKMKIPFSRDIAVWVTKDCNQRCKYCFYDGTDIWGSSAHMTIETAKEVCKFINSGIPKLISFFGGEPLFNWPIMKFILENTTNKGVTYFTTTNGTLLTPEILKTLKKHRVGLNLSLDGTRETQNTWRDNSYDAIIKNLPGILKHHNVTVLKTMASPNTFYEDVKHIQSLGFKKMFTNNLDPYSPTTLEGYSTEDFKYQYYRAVKDFHGKFENGRIKPGKIQMNDFVRWSQLIKEVHAGNKKTGCGFVNHGISIGVEGGFYPCLQAPSFPDFKVGDLWQGIDFEKRKTFQNIERTLCNECNYRLNKCPETMYRKHGKFGVNPPRWFAEFEVAKIEVIEDLLGLPHLETACKGGELF